MYEFTQNAQLKRIWQQVDKQHDLKPPPRPPIQNLVLEGSGTKALALCGGLQALQDNNKLKEVKRVAGGVPAMLLAIGCTAEEIKDIIENELNTKALMDRRVKFDPTRFFKYRSVKVGVSDIITLFKHKGLFKGEKYLKVMKKVVARKLEESLRREIKTRYNKQIEDLIKRAKLSDMSESELNKAVKKYIDEMLAKHLEKLYINDLGLITFKQLNDLKKSFPNLAIKELYIPTTRMSDATGKLFSAESDPHVPICEVARMSMSYPHGAEPVRFQGDYFAAGDIGYRNPMSIFDSEKYAEFELNDAHVNPATLGIIVDDEEAINARWGIRDAKKGASMGLVKFINSIIRSLRDRSDVLRDKYDINAIQIYDHSISSVAPKLSDKQKKKLYNGGKDAIQHYVDMYHGKHVQYGKEESYQNSAEKYHSKSTNQLIRILENELFPLYKELHLLTSINYAESLGEIERQLSGHDPNEVKYQDQLYDQLNLLANEMEAIDERRTFVESELSNIEKETRLLYQRWDAMSEKDKIKYQAEFYASQANITRMKEKYNSELSKLNEMIEDGKVRYQDLNQHINRDIFPLIEKMKFCHLVVDNKMDVKFKETLLNLDDHITMILKLIKHKKNDYPDPRQTGLYSKVIYDLRGKDFESLVRRNQKHYKMNEDEATSRALQSIEDIENFMLFGASLTEAQELEAQLALIQNIFDLKEARIRLLSNFLVKKLIAMNLITDTTEEINIVKNYYRDVLLERMAAYPNMKMTELECSVKKDIIQLCRFSKTSSTNEALKSIRKPKAMSENVTLFNHYADYLSKLMAKLSLGRWSDYIEFTNQNYVDYNLKYMQREDGETYGQISASYNVKMVEFDAQKKMKYPIKAHIATPDIHYLHNDAYPIKEMVVIFNDPMMKEGYTNLLSAEQEGVKRKKHFEQIKNELLKQIKWSIRQMREAGLNPPNSKIALTLYGEGLSAVDAQYMMDALLTEIQNSNAAHELYDVIKLDLVLKDPIRVEKSKAVEAAEKIAKIKERRGDIQIGGYNLIHRTHARRQLQNYLGEANLLSYVDPKDAEVLVDVRNSHDPSFQHKILSNRSDNVVQYLNRKSPFYRSAAFQVLHLVFNKLKKGISFAFRSSFPRICKFIYKVGVYLPKRIFKNLTNPILRLQKIFKKRKPYQIKRQPWVRVIERNQRDAQVVPAELTGSGKIRSFNMEVEDFINKGQPSARLAYRKKPPIENLVFEGGGVKGLVYVGALESMTANNLMKDVKRVSGSSAGAIVSHLIAIGYQAHEIRELLLSVINFKDFMDEPYSLGGIDKIFEVSGLEIGFTSMLALFKNKGLFKGDAFKNMMTHLTRVKLEQNVKNMLCGQLSQSEINAVLSTPADLTPAQRDERIDAFLTTKLEKLKLKYQIDDFGLITFAQLKMLSEDFPELDIKQLYLTGTNLSEASLSVFSAESHPNMRVVDAVRISMSFPGGFAPVEYEGKLYADGGIANNYPIQIFDAPQFLSHGVNDAGVNPCTLGFLVDSEEEIKSRWGMESGSTKSMDGGQFLGAVLAGIHNRAEVLKDKYNINSIQIIDNIATTGYRGAQTLDLNISDKGKAILIENGRKAMDFYIANYLGEDIGQHLQLSYENLMQKYYLKPVLELQTILKEEVQPLLREFSLIEPRLLKQKEKFEGILAELEIALAPYEDLTRLIEKEIAISIQERGFDVTISQKEEELQKIEIKLGKLQAMKVRVLADDPGQAEKTQKSIVELNEKVTSLSERKRTLEGSITSLKNRKGRLTTERLALAIPEDKAGIIPEIRKKIEVENHLNLLEHALDVRNHLVQEENVIINALRSKGEKKPKPIQTQSSKVSKPPSHTARTRLRAN